VKPRSPVWLCESFRDGVDERELVEVGAGFASEWRYYGCWLAQFDPLEQDCGGRNFPYLERFHFISRQRVENALGALLPWWASQPLRGGFRMDERNELILLAAWDPRNGGIACEAHHRRLDSHATPELVVPRSALPKHVLEFAEEWGLESQLESKFPDREVVEA
jgi:hypothetical protein